MRQQDRDADHVALVGVPVGQQQVLGSLVTRDRHDRVEGPALREGVRLLRQLGEHGIDGGTDLLVRHPGFAAQAADAGDLFGHSGR